MSYNDHYYSPSAGNNSHSTSARGHADEDKRQQQEQFKPYHQDHSYSQYSVAQAGPSHSFVRPQSLTAPSVASTAAASGGAAARTSAPGPARWYHQGNQVCFLLYVHRRDTRC